MTPNGFVSSFVPRGALSLMAVLAALGACTTPPGQEPGPNDAQTARLAELRSVEQAIHEQMEQAGPTIASAKDLPTSGQASFDGIMSLSVPSLSQSGVGDILYGQANANLEFAGAASTLTGSATSFRSLDNEAYEGSLTFDGQPTTPNPIALSLASPSLLSGDVDGTLTGPDDETLNVDASLYSEVYEGGEMMSGTVYGSATVTSEDGGQTSSGTAFGTLLLIDAPELFD